MTTAVTYGDLTRDPGEVARGLVAWRRGDPAEAAVQTLAASARELTRTRYTLWIWSGYARDGAPAWALPIAVRTVIRFTPRGPAAMLLRCLETAVSLDARASRLRLEDWRGYACLVAPGLLDDIGGPFVEEGHPSPGRARLTALPDDIVLGGPPIPVPSIVGLRADDPVTALASALDVHPVRVALILLTKGIAPSTLTGDGSAYAGPLREWGCAGDGAPAPPPPSLAIRDDPCPRRRHARTVLQRLLRMGKVGVGYHTDIANFARGAAAHDRHQALETAEHLLRAGLLGEKPSVGQRHIYLSRAALPAIHALIDRGETGDVALAATWTAPAPGDAP